MARNRVACRWSSAGARDRRIFPQISSQPCPTRDNDKMLLVRKRPDIWPTTLQNCQFSIDIQTWKSYVQPSTLDCLIKQQWRDHSQWMTGFFHHYDQICRVNTSKCCCFCVWQNGSHSNCFNKTPMLFFLQWVMILLLAIHLQHLEMLVSIFKKKSIVNNGKKKRIDVEGLSEAALWFHAELRRDTLCVRKIE